ncbi:MAG: ATP-binding protein [Clostridia bacterium]|nr:ATP-binding protein [Clostridia bacterium]
MLRRKAWEKLISWKNSDNKKALCIIGARQIGKTTLARNFGKEYYENFVEINFVTDSKAADIFSGSLDADTIITNLTAYIRKPMEPGNTLVLFDEIQECPNARTAIKFLVEDGRFDYIETGSMLGVRFKDVRSYPVGFEEIYRMHPLDFEEFLWANSVPDSTIEHLYRYFKMMTVVPPVIHDTMMKLFRTYIVVGGMPQVVNTYIETHDIGKVVANQKEILELYRLDIAKYSNNSSKLKIQAIFDSIPSQLDDKNRRFILTKIDEKGRQNRYENSFEWLSDAGVALPCYNVIEPQPALQLNEKHNLFKLFMADTGLLCAACMENVQFDILNGNLEINMGSILENVMAQSIKYNGFRLHYFDAKKYGEIDFVIQNGTHVDIIEVKSGKDYKKHKALDNVLGVKEWTFGQAYVLCNGNVENERNVFYLPWYMIIFFKQEQIPEGQIYELDISSLL